MSAPSSGNAYPTPDEFASALAPFLGRRLRGIWRLHDAQAGVIDLWLAFNERPEAPDVVRLTATPVVVLPGWIGGGGPTTPTLRIEVSNSLPTQVGENWYPFSEPPSGDVHAFSDWTLTEIWLSQVADNIDAPGGYRIEDVCGGLALHFSNTRGPNFQARLLGMTYEHHDMDAPQVVFCEETLPPLIGSGPWRRIGYLKEETQLEDAEVRHFSPHDFGTPALAGAASRFEDTLHIFSRWFEREPRTGWLTAANTKRWLGHHRRHLDKVTNIFFHADLILQRSTECGEDLKAEMAAFGLGTLFSDAWASHDGASADDRLPASQSVLLAEIRRHYAPVREAYRQWFVLFRQACTDEKRRLVRWTYEPTPEWVLTLDAALTRGSLRLETLLEIPGARWLRDDFRDGWEACEDCTWFVQQGGLKRNGTQDVLIEGDEEHADSLRITCWPMVQRRDRVMVLRVPRDALVAWWASWHVPEQLSPFEEMLAGRAKRPPVPEHWPSLPEILDKVIAPPKFDAERIKLPPYTEDDIRAVYLQCMQGHPEEDWLALRDRAPEVVWACDSKLRFIPLLLGRDVHPLSAWSSLNAPTERVAFPAAWPATWVGRGPFYLMWSHGHWREEKAEGLDFRPYNWLLPVLRQISITEDGVEVLRWRWGLIDIDGRFVLPCQFPAMGFPQTHGVGKAIEAEIPLPPCRREPWCWVWTGEEERTDGCWYSHWHSAPGDIVEAWSGTRPLAPGMCAQRLEGHFALVSQAEKGKDGPIGLCNLATGQYGPMRWRHIDTFNLSIYHAAPAQCFETGLWTYIDDNGSPLLPTDFARAGRIDSGLAFVQLGLERAEAEGLTLTLPDGSRHGPVGVFGPNGRASLGQWFVAPRWREVLGEYDGHFVVQDVAGHWGMVTPEGDAVTAFLPRRDRDEFNGDILQQVMAQFKRAQNRRFLGCLNEAAQAGSLGVMNNKLHSSFGRYDYGALFHAEIPVRTLREVMPAPGSEVSEESINTPRPAGAEFAWRPRQRNYFGSIDLRTHCAIGPRSDDRGESGYHGIYVPWDALALDLPPAEYGDAIEQRQIGCLQSREYQEALDRLLDTLSPCIDLIDCESDSSYAPALEGSCNLDMLLLRLAEIAKLDHSRGYRELILNRLHHDLPEIDFPNLLNVQAGDTTEENSKYVIVDNRWIERPEPQTQWSDKVHAAHRLALAAYLDWEAIHQRGVDTNDERQSCKE